MESKRRAKLNGWAQLGAMLAFIAAGLTIHGSVIVPQMREEMRPLIREHIQNHAKSIHKGAVSRNEFELILRQLNSIQRALKER